MKVLEAIRCRAILMMSLRALNRGRKTRFDIVLRLHGIALIGFFFLCGCATPHRSPPSKQENFPEPDLTSIYFRAEPFSKLYVEVDAVEGSEPSDAALEKLRSFLAAHCDKPAGIEVVRSDVISVKSARGKSATALARHYVNGPPEATDSASALLYVLFYNDAYSTQSKVQLTSKGAGLLLVPNRDVASPFAESWPYPSICFNTGFTLGVGTQSILCHEAGHILGLVRRPGVSGPHCTRWRCAMQNSGAYIKNFSWLLGAPSDHLCSDCQKELRERARNDAPKNLRYVGSVLVRSEEQYHVLHLPHETKLLVGKLTEEDCADFVATKDSMRSDQFWFSCKVKDEALTNSNEIKFFLNRFKNDPDVSVRRFGSGLFLRQCAQQYESTRQFAKRIGVLEQITQIEPKDPWAYNQLAWMKATCPEASVRDGTEAIAIATKTCEMNGWKHHAFINTLAASYAETSDFKKAIEFQERALRTGKPTQVEQDRMKRRLEMYRQSQPFRTE